MMVVFIITEINYSTILRAPFDIYISDIRFYGYAIRSSSGIAKKEPCLPRLPPTSCTLFRGGQCNLNINLTKSFVTSSKKNTLVEV